MIVPLCCAPRVQAETGRLIKDHFGTKKLPPLGEIFVKVVDHRGFVLVGTYTLEKDDLPGSGFPGPWLADLVVKPEFRGKGYAKELLRDAKDRAGAPLYLWCANPLVFRVFLEEGFRFVCAFPARPTNVAVFLYDE